MPVSMITQFCRLCNRKTLHNPRKKSSPTSEQTYRCTSCGDPRRFGNLNSKNIVERKMGRIVWGGDTVGLK